MIGSDQRRLAAIGGGEHYHISAVVIWGLWLIIGLAESRYDRWEMQHGARLNPIDDICKRLSLAYLLADKDDPEIQEKAADTELDGLYEFAKMIYAISRSRQFQPKVCEELLEAIGLQVKYPPTPELKLDEGPNLFIANSSGCSLVDGAIGTILMARLGLRGSIVAAKEQHLTATPEEVICVEHPKIQAADPRCDSDIAKTNAKAILQMRSALANGRSLLLFPGDGTFQSNQNGQTILNGSFDRLAPVLLACSDLRPTLHLYHFHYDMPGWWTELLDSDQARFRAMQWKAVLALQPQIAEVRHVTTADIRPSIDKRRRYELCRELLELTAKMATSVPLRRADR